MPCSISSGSATFDFDMIEDRWEQSLSPGNEQTFYWGSAAADQQGSRNYIGVEKPGGGCHDRGAAARRASGRTLSPRCVRSIAC